MEEEPKKKGMVEGEARIAERVNVLSKIVRPYMYDGMLMIIYL